MLRLDVGRSYPVHIQLYDRRVNILHWVCFWPGLAELWCRGNPRALAAAVLFSWTVCLVLLATFFWPDWLGVWITRTLWIVVVVVWFASVIYSHLRFAAIVGSPDSKAQDAFQQAQMQYLQGNWFEAEAILLDLLERFPRDVESLLLLVGVLRHTQRWSPALRRLEMIESLDNAAFWRFEILRERQIIERKLAESIASDNRA